MGDELGIIKIEYENIKSLKNTFLSLSEVNVLVGRNGAGKTNIQKYLNYFYNNLLHNNISQDVFDKKNPYNDWIKIKVTYNLSAFRRMGIDKPKAEILNQINLNIGEDITEITITFTQFKNNTVKWSHPYEVRKLIKYLFPIYLIDTRNIDLLNWDNIWDLMGDLGQSRSENESYLLEGLDEVLEAIYGEKHLIGFEELKLEFESNEYNIKSYKNSELFKQLYKLMFTGEEFNYKKNDLDFYSNGSNSFNYLRIFYLVLKQLHINKWKSPLVILDEPEIGLHPSVIDELINFISNDCGRIQTILSTHSSRIVRNGMLLKNAYIFQINQEKHQTEIKKVKAFGNTKLNKVISDKEASYYFSSGILFVEGVTEYELFTHPIIKRRFSILKKVEIFSYNSNNISLDVSHPNQRKMNIPYLLLLDLDKILKYIPQNNRFKIVGDSYNPLKNKEIERKENFFYGDKRSLQLLRKRIEGITKKVSFSYSPYTFTFNDKFFIGLINLVTYYCKQYNVFPVKTTIEGVLINKKNYELFYEWLTRDESQYSEKNKFITAYHKSSNINYRLNILRTIVEGNLEPLFSLKKSHINSLPNSPLKDGYKIIDTLPKIKKGSGWVSDFLEYVYKKLKENEQLKEFEFFFPELADIIDTIEIIME